MSSSSETPIEGARGDRQPGRYYGQGMPYLPIDGYPGKLIAIEGTDGIGRNTQIQLLREWLEVKGYGVVETGWTRSPLMQPTIELAKSSNTLNKLTFVLLYATCSLNRAYTAPYDARVTYTPNLAAPGYPDDRIIAVDLGNRVTRVLNSDYFGESKKGGLRMWNTIVYDRGGLALHAGCKSVPAKGEESVFLIIGLSGTGKTTTTFTTQNDSLPVQDDFVALMPDGHVFASENGCFAKTFSLDPDFEPNIYRAVTKPGAYLENVYQDDRATVNFFETSYTKNGRAVFELRDLGRYKDARDLEKVDFLLILNWNENIIPAVSRLDRTQAAAYFMLGETQGTAAGGADRVRPGLWYGGFHGIVHPVRVGG